MKNALSDVPGLLEEWRESGNDKWVALLRARSALADACDDAVNTAAREGRGLTAGEQRAVDAHLGQTREINGWLAEYKRQRIADLAAEGLSADHCRVPF